MSDIDIVGDWSWGQKIAQIMAMKKDYSIAKMFSPIIFVDADKSLVFVGTFGEWRLA